MKCPCCGGDISGRDRPYVSLETNRMAAGAEIIQLSPTQAEIIYSLAEAMPLPLHNERLFQKIWGVNQTGKPEVTLRVIITKLRKKIEPTGMQIKSVWGVGYVLEYASAD